MQQAFIDHDALQCGYCTPGQICSAVGSSPSSLALAERRHRTPRRETATLDEHEVRERMSGNLCRCGAYVNIVAAVLDAAR